MAISVSARKAKGRRLQNWVASKISAILGIPYGKDEMISPREMGQSGTDVRLIGEAQTRFPFSIECKNQETWYIHEWMKQAKENEKVGTDWLLFMCRNDTEEIVCMDAKAFFRLMATAEFKKPSSRLQPK